MRTLLEDFLASEKMLRDQEVQDLLGWSADTLKQKRARKEAPPSVKVKAIHLTKYSDLADFIEITGTPAGGLQSPAVGDLLGRRKA